MLDIITGGQELDLERFAGASAENIIALKSAIELDDYTYRVAGCVGEFWTQMCRAHLFPHAELEDAQLFGDSIRFGKGLQLVNILRDLPADLHKGRCYLPSLELDQAGLMPTVLVVARERIQVPAVFPSLPRSGGIASAGGLELYQLTAARADACAAGLRVADFDRRQDD